MEPTDAVGEEEEAARVAAEEEEEAARVAAVAFILTSVLAEPKGTGVITHGALVTAQGSDTGLFQLITARDDTAGAISHDEWVAYWAKVANEGKRKGNDQVKTAMAELNHLAAPPALEVAISDFELGFAARINTAARNAATRKRRKQRAEEEEQGRLAAAEGKRAADSEAMLPFPPSGSQPKAEVSGVDEQKEETEGTADLLQQHAPGSKDSPTISSVEKQVVKKKEAHTSQCLIQMFVAGRGSEPTPEEVYNEVKAVFEQRGEAGDGDNKLDEEEIVATLVTFYRNAKLSRPKKKVKANVDKYLESHDVGTHVDLAEFFEMLFEPEFNLILSAECRTAALALLRNDVEDDEGQGSAVDEKAEMEAAAIAGAFDDGRGYAIDTSEVGKAKEETAKAKEAKRERDETAERQAIEPTARAQKEANEAATRAREQAEKKAKQDADVIVAKAKEELEAASVKSRQDWQDTAKKLKEEAKAELGREKDLAEAREKEAEKNAAEAQMESENARREAEAATVQAQLEVEMVRRQAEEQAAQAKLEAETVKREAEAAIAKMVEEKAHFQLQMGLESLMTLKAMKRMKTSDGGVDPNDGKIVAVEDAAQKATNDRLKLIMKTREDHRLEAEGHAKMEKLQRIRTMRAKQPKSPAARSPSAHVVEAARAAAEREAHLVAREAEVAQREADLQAREKAAAS